MSRCLTSI